MSSTFTPLKINKHLHFPLIDSTNTWAKTHIDQWSSDHITLISASQQTQGKGQFNRFWHSPANVNIYATYCFWIDLTYQEIGNIPQVFALTLAQILERENFNPQVKWPNDVLLSKKKLAGILCETIRDKNKIGVICGIGINVNMPFDLLQQVDQPATSLLNEIGKITSLKVWLSRFNHALVKNINLFLNQGFCPFLPLFHHYCHLKKNELICIQENGKITHAYFDTLNLDGSLTLTLLNGEKKNLISGEVLMINKI